ncbi:MAG TPA: hypothetical protein VIL29_10130 [Pseudothermotoga sp.]|uniref:hypothetical protein n=1 Tax=Thermotoga profunda TaxID=1508420 RepID=UPI000A3E3736|nr:hypothetical protein [Thermotoga profunda]
MKKGSLIVAGLVILVIVFAMLFSIQKLLDMRISGFAPLEKESIIHDAAGSR